MKLKKLLAAALSLAIFCTSAPKLIDYSTSNYLTASAADERFIGLWVLAYNSDKDNKDTHSPFMASIFNLRKDGTASAKFWLSGEESKYDELLWTSDDNNVYITYTDNERQSFVDFTFSHNELIYECYYENDFISTYHFLKTSLGDTNEDGSIDAKDASLILVEYATLSTDGYSTFLAKEREVSDINYDNNIDAKDASIVLSYYTYLSTGGKKSIYQYLG